MSKLVVNYAQKIIAIKRAEKLSPEEFCTLTGISLRSMKMYKSGQRPAGASALEKVMQVKSFEKYTLWLLHNNQTPAAGQIDPVLSLWVGEMVRKCGSVQPERAWRRV